MEAVNHQTAGKSAKAVCSLPGKLMSPQMIFNGLATWIFGTAVRPLAKGAVSQSWLRVISSFDLYHQSERPGEQARRQQGSRHGDEPRLGAGCVAQPSHQIGSGKTPGRAD